MSKPFPCLETTIDMQIGEHNVRLWIDREDIPTDLTKEKDIANDLRKLNVLPIAPFIESVKFLFPKISAIQIREGEAGVVIYLTDFTTDIHG